MSSTPKGTALRLVMPEPRSSKISSILGPGAKLQSATLVLTAGRLTTEQIVNNIREFIRLRDDLLHTMRQLGIQREPGKSNDSKFDYASLLKDGKAQLEESRRQNQEAQSGIEVLERQVEDARKQISKLSEVAEAGFTSGDALSSQGQFSKLLGRLPVRKLEAAQRALESTFQDQIVMSQGNRKKDWAYLLVATPTDKTPQTLQTLILYDFVQTEIPSSEEPDLKKALLDLEETRTKLSKQLELEKEEMKNLRSEAGKTLNQLADTVQDALITLRAILRLGDGTKVAHALAWMEKTPNPKIVDALSAEGAVVEIE